jgi:cytochrome oxidase assembly protein ShyY1
MKVKASLLAYISPVKNFGISLLALSILALCITAGFWQYERGMDRRAESALLKENIDLPAIDFPTQSTGTTQPTRTLEELQWRKFLIAGSFIPENEILLRNRYYNDQYGYGVATLFRLLDGRKVWIDRGWVKAGASATEPPIVEATPTGDVNLLVRFRSDNLEAKIAGSFFATGDNGDQLARWNAEAKVESEEFYFDLIGGDFLPDVASVFSPPGSGPHIAYAIQWWFFAALVLFGRFLIAREDLRKKSA